MSTEHQFTCSSETASTIAEALARSDKKVSRGEGGHARVAQPLAPVNGGLNLNVGDGFYQ